MDTLQPGVPGVEARSATLEAAILRNRAEKKGLPDCPCWGNAPRLVDAELYSVLDERPAGESAGTRLKRLEDAVRKHREDTEATPECTCWSTSSRKADAELYKVLWAEIGRDPVAACQMEPSTGNEP
jgi:hypothetical protein